MQQQQNSEITLNAQMVEKINWLQYGGNYDLDSCHEPGKTEYNSQLDGVISDIDSIIGYLIRLYYDYGMEEIPTEGDRMMKSLFELQHLKNHFEIFRVDL